MAKKTKVTQRAREEQWRRRVEQQSRQAVAGPAAATFDDDIDDVQEDSVEYMQAEIQPMPSGVSTSARATTPTAARTPRTTPTTPSATRRTASATRASRLAFQQTMSLDPSAVDLGAYGHNVMVEAPEIVWDWIESLL